MKTFNCKITKIKRRELRKTQTEAERKLWNKLRNKQIGGYKFFRQYGIGPYIVDFYCPLLKIAIEVDGGQHYFDKVIIYDQRRAKFLKQEVVKILRFNNSDILKNMEGVFECIQNELP